MDVTIVLPAGKIPLNMKVRKVAGAEQYTLRKSIMIYGDGERRQCLETDGASYLLHSQYIECVPDSKLLAIDLPLEEAIALLSLFRNQQ